MSVLCGHCGSSLGEIDDFGFLSLDEKMGRKSHHLVLRHEKLSEFVANIVNVDPVLEKNLYYVIYCKDCSNDIGKKMMGKGISYIAFGKEKVSVCGTILTKADKWANHMDACEEYRSLKRLRRSDFLPNRQNAPVSSSTQRDWRTGMSGVGRVTATAVSDPAHRMQGRGSFSSRNTFSSSTQPVPPPTGVAGGGGPVRAPPERQTVGPTTEERLKFLRTTTNKWEASQLIHELTGLFFFP
jgi:hypothetical protein